MACERQGLEERLEESKERLEMLERHLDAGAGEPCKKPLGLEAGGASFLYPLELDHCKTFILIKQKAQPQ